MRARDRLSRSVGSRLLRQTSWMLVSQGVRLVCQMLYFVLVARTLGVRDFGALAAGVALVAVLMPFAGWGSGSVLVMEGARLPDRLAELWGNALMTIAIGGGTLVAVAVGITHLYLAAVPATLVLLIGVGDFFFGRVVNVAAQAFQAVDRLAYTACIDVLTPALRATAAVAFVAGSARPTLQAWGLLYMLAAATAAAIAFTVVRTRLVRPRFTRRWIRRTVTTGGLFAVGQSAASAYLEINKTLLARLATLEATGMYAAAHRVVSMASLPISALLGATYLRFFQAGARGVRGTKRLAERLLLPTAAYGALVGGGILLAAPLGPVVLGDDYEESVSAIRWLAPIPVLQACYSLPADALTGAGRQGVRTCLQAAAVVVNVALSAVLIPQHSWRGAAWALLISLATLGASLWLAVNLLAAREARLAPAETR